VESSQLESIILYLDIYMDVVFC